MNFCCRCQSFYSQPGTCNCYVPDIGITLPGTDPTILPGTGGNPWPGPYRVPTTTPPWTISWGERIPTVWCNARGPIAAGDNSQADISVSSVFDVSPN